jgi:hypothetical protein
MPSRLKSEKQMGVYVNTTLALKARVTQTSVVDGMGNFRKATIKRRCNFRRRMQLEAALGGGLIHFRP